MPVYVCIQILMYFDVLNTNHTNDYKTTNYTVCNLLL